MKEWKDTHLTALKHEVDHLLQYVSPTIFIGLYDGLIALFPSFWVGQDHFQADVGVGWQVSHQVSWCYGEKKP